MDENEVPRGADLRQFLGIGADKGPRKQYAYFDELRLQQFEDGVVKHLLRHHRLQQYARNIQDRSERLLSLEAFYEEFPQYPMRMHARQFANVVRDTPVHRLWNDFEGLTFVKAYRELAEPDAAIVFSWPYLTAKIGESPKGPGVILHTRTEIEGTAGVRITCRVEAGETFILEPLTHFLHALDLSTDDDWKTR